MKIKIFTIEKSSRDEYESVCSNLLANISIFSDVEMIALFDNKIKSAQNIGANEARSSYSAALLPKLGSYNIALDVQGKELDSYGFANTLKDRGEVCFVIGGAFGFERSFLEKCSKVISLSRLTFGHKIAKIVLLEQIFRGLSILNNHPYHK